MFNEKTDYFNNIERAIQFLTWNYRVSQITQYMKSHYVMTKKAWNILTQLAYRGSYTRNSFTFDHSYLIKNLISLHLVRLIARKYTPPSRIECTIELTDLGRQYVNYTFPSLRTDTNKAYHNSEFYKRKHKKHMENLSTVLYIIGALVASAVLTCGLLNALTYFIKPNDMAAPGFSVSDFIVLICFSLIIFVIGSAIDPYNSISEQEQSKIPVGKWKAIPLSQFINFISHNNRWLIYQNNHYDNFFKVIKDNYIWRL